MKSTRSLLLLVTAALISTSAQAWDPTSSVNPPVAPELSGGSPISNLGSSLASGDIDAVKGTVGIVCVGNDGKKLTWFPAAANSTVTAHEIRKCFEEIAMNWHGVVAHPGLPDGQPTKVPSPMEAYEGLLDIMGDLEKIAP